MLLECVWPGNHGVGGSGRGGHGQNFDGGRVPGCVSGDCGGRHL